MRAGVGKVRASSVTREPQAPGAALPVPSSSPSDPRRVARHPRGRPCVSPAARPGVPPVGGRAQPYVPWQRGEGSGCRVLGTGRRNADPGGVGMDPEVLVRPAAEGRGRTGQAAGRSPPRRRALGSFVGEDAAGDGDLRRRPPHPGAFVPWLPDPTPGAPGPPRLPGAPAGPCAPPRLRSSYRASTPSLGPAGPRDSPPRRTRPARGPRSTPPRHPRPHTPTCPAGPSRHGPQPRPRAPAAPPRRTQPRAAPFPYGEWAGAGVD